MYGSTPPPQLAALAVLPDTSWNCPNDLKAVTLSKNASLHKKRRWWCINKMAHRIAGHATVVGVVAASFKPFRIEDDKHYGHTSKAVNRNIFYTK
jgi:hypothetical protein